MVAGIPGALADPAHRSHQLRKERIPLEWAFHIARGPAAMEATGLGQYRLAVHPAALYGAGVVGLPAGMFAERRGGIGVLSDRPSQPPRLSVGPTDYHIEVAGDALSSSEAASFSRLQHGLLQGLGGQIERGWMEGLEHPQAVLDVGEQAPPVAGAAGEMATGAPPLFLRGHQGQNPRKGGSDAAHR